MRNALRGLCETVMLSWTRTTSDVEAPAHAHDRAFVSSHAKIQPRNAVRFEVSWTEYSRSLDEPNHVGDSVVEHGGDSLLNVGNYIQFPTYCK